MIYSDYVIYVDESDDHSLKPIDRDYPVFVLDFCIFWKDHYANAVAPRVQTFKFTHFGWGLYTRLNGAAEREGDDVFSLIALAPPLYHPLNARAGRRRSIGAWALTPCFSITAARMARARRFCLSSVFIVGSSPLRAGVALKCVAGRVCDRYGLPFPRLLGGKHVFEPPISPFSHVYNPLSATISSFRTNKISASRNHPSHS